jgi:2-polyprenyl-3-methyl-5-hydroxy-6-metoxy-1,4-benzoquinol methylase
MDQGRRRLEFIEQEQAMVATDKVFSGSIPEIYHRLLVPLIFEPYACDLAGRITKANPGRVLETAAGTGVLTKALAAQLPANAHITATDLNEPMLALAKSRLSDERIAWQQADALALPFDGGSFDAVACQFGAMFFPDRVKG